MLDAVSFEIEKNILFIQIHSKVYRQKIVGNKFDVIMWFPCKTWLIVTRHKISFLFKRHTDVQIRCLV